MAPSLAPATVRTRVRHKTGVHAGQPLNSEISDVGVPTQSRQGEGHTSGSDIASSRSTPRSQRPCTCVETPCARTGRARSCPRRWRRGTVGEGKMPTVRHARLREVARSRSTNEAGEQSHDEAWSRYCDTRERKGEQTVNTNIDLNRDVPAESVEERRSTKGNDLAVGRAPDSEPEERVDRLEAVRQAARRDRKTRFTALLHHITPRIVDTQPPPPEL